MTRSGTAVITGASSGIGRAFALRLARDGYTLVLHGRREQLLKELCEEVRRTCGVEATYVIAELSHPEELHELEQRVRQIPDLTLLVNNAGFGTGKTFEKEDPAMHEAMIQTHLTAPVRLSHAALPAMMRRKAGAIINVSSVAGFMVSPGSLYCGTKAALTNFSESLAMLVRDDGVKVQALCPGFTRSDFHQRIGMDVLGSFFKHFMSAEEVVEASMKALARGKVVCIPGATYKLAVAIQRYIPRRFMYGLARAYRKLRGTKRGV